MMLVTSMSVGAAVAAATWDAGALSSGLYYYRFLAGGFVETKKALFLK